MTTTSIIIREGYREGQLIDLGKTPSTDQLSEGALRLNTIVAGVFGNEVGDDLVDWPIGNEGLIIPTSWTSASWKYVVVNARMIANMNSAQTIYLPPNPPDGARVQLVDPKSLLATYNITIDANGRTIEGATTKVLSTAGESNTWFYRADLADWTLLSALTGVDPEEFPFPKEFDDYFITKLAMRVNPRYGRSIKGEQAIILDRELERLRAKYETPINIPADLGVLGLTNDGRPKIGRSFGDNPKGWGGYNIVRGRMGWWGE